MAQNLNQVDWSKIPAPDDDGSAAHLEGMTLPNVALAVSKGGMVDLGALQGCVVLYIYPRTGRPDQDLPKGWDMIPGARGCTPQSCAFRDHFTELQALGVDHLYGLSTQDTDYQAEAAHRMHLPFALLSDLDLTFADALSLPRFETDGMTLLNRMTLIAREGAIEKVFYPVFPPDQNAQDVADYLRA
ncbi:peroxiredoxin [Algirhabdus cladophorae]|uniref:peroxiredoxin n=1 Tax=Algirhabdus cladophorae TaxID=3377108 RepID=UPI003B848243